MLPKFTIKIKFRSKNSFEDELCGNVNYTHRVSTLAWKRTYRKRREGRTGLDFSRYLHLGCSQSKRNQNWMENDSPRRWASDLYMKKICRKREIIHEVWSKGWKLLILELCWNLLIYLRFVELNLPISSEENSIELQCTGH